MTKKIIASLLCVMLIVSSVVIASAADTSKSAAGDNSYTTACESIDAEYAYSGNDLADQLPVRITSFPANTRIKQITPATVQYVVIKQP